MSIVLALFFLLLPFVFHLVVTGSLLGGLWIYFIGAIVTAIFVLQESSN
ncbi:MAG: hypothetical protein AAB420_00785 [Patescibacteria group bacterium]